MKRLGIAIGVLCFLSGQIQASDPIAIVSCDPPDATNPHIRIFQPSADGQYPIDLGGAKQTGLGSMKKPAGGMLNFDGGSIGVRVLAGAEEDIIAVLRTNKPPKSDDPQDMICSWASIHNADPSTQSGD